MRHFRLAVLALLVSLACATTAHALLARHNVTVNVPVVASTNGTALDVSDLGRKVVTIEGTFTATYQVQINLNPAAAAGDASWINEGATITTPGSLEVTKPIALIRVRCTAYTSGTPTGRLTGER